MNTTIHHEMVTPLNINVDVAQHIMQKLENKELKDLAQMIFINSKLIRFYANDLLDQRILKNGSFKPLRSYQSAFHAILEIIQIIRWNVQHRNLKIDFQRCQ